MQNKINQPAPPNLLSGIVLVTITTTLTIIACTWLIINSKVEQLVSQRTSEYAHSIARVAADSSAEALLSGDVLQLNLLVQNVAKDPYIRQATIYSENGQIVSQYPEEIKQTSKEKAKKQAQAQTISELNEINSSSKNINPENDLEKQSEQFMLRQKNIPFIESITYQDITAGWFKLEINSYQLEKSFRDAYFEIQLFSAGVAFVFILLMATFIMRMQSSILSVVNSCQHFLIQNRLKPPKNKSAWVDAIAELANEHPQQLKEHCLLPLPSTQWHSFAKLENTLVCILEFKVNSSENLPIAEFLSLAEQYLNKAVQAYGVQSQGDILTGCLVPFPTHKSQQKPHHTNQINDALCFVELVKRLIESIPFQIDVKACLVNCSILVLEDEHEMITGVSLVGDVSNQVNQLFSFTDSNDTLALNLTTNGLNPFAEVSMYTQEQFDGPLAHKLTRLVPSIAQQNARKFSYIVES